MRPITSALLLALVAFPATAIAQNRQKSTAIPYEFRTLMIPAQPAQGPRTVSKRSAWFGGRAVPARVVTLDAPVTVPKVGVVLQKGLELAVATSSHFIACQKELSVTNGLLGMGRSPVCLIDFDQDGALDSWFKSSVPILFGQFRGHIQRDDIYPIGRIETTELSADQKREMPPWGTFQVKYARGMLTFCVGFSDLCLSKGPKIRPSNVEQKVEFMGGLFSYRALESGSLVVSTIRDPKEVIF